MIKEGLLYILIVGIPVIACVEFFCIMDDRSRKARKAENERIKRELGRGHHPSNGEDR